MDLGKQTGKPQQKTIPPNSIKIAVTSVFLQCLQAPNSNGRPKNTEKDMKMLHSVWAVVSALMLVHLQWHHKPKANTPIWNLPLVQVRDLPQNEYVWVTQTFVSPMQSTETDTTKTPRRQQTKQRLNINSLKLVSKATRVQNLEKRSQKPRETPGAFVVSEPLQSGTAP